MGACNRSCDQLAQSHSLWAVWRWEAWHNQLAHSHSRWAAWRKYSAAPRCLSPLSCSEDLQKYHDVIFTIVLLSMLELAYTKLRQNAARLRPVGSGELFCAAV